MQKAIARRPKGNYIVYVNKAYSITIIFSKNSGLEKTLNSSSSFGQAAPTFCLPRAPSCSSYLMIWLKDDLLRPLPNGASEFKSYWPRKKICLLRMTIQDFFSSPEMTKITATDTMRLEAQENLIVLHSSVGRALQC